MWKEVIVLSLITVISLTSAESCATLKSYVESACEYPSLKLISSPSSIVVNKNNCNKEFAKSEWQQQPQVLFSQAESGKTYTVIAIDPDAPNHDPGQYYLHWIASNIKGEQLAVGDLSSANIVQPYVGPSPPKNTGIHRYIFLVFREEQINQDVNSPEARRKFDLLPWLRGQTKKLCGPVAGVQFRAQF